MPIRNSQITFQNSTVGDINYLLLLTLQCITNHHPCLLHRSLPHPHPHPRMYRTRSNLSQNTNSSILTITDCFTHTINYYEFCIISLP